MWSKRCGQKLEIKIAHCRLSIWIVARRAPFEFCFGAEADRQAAYYSRRGGRYDRICTASDRSFVFLAGPRSSVVTTTTQMIRFDWPNVLMCLLVPRFKRHHSRLSGTLLWWQSSVEERRNLEILSLLGATSPEKRRFAFEILVSVSL